MTKRESKELQGIAILMMLYHHLFAFPEKIEYPYASLADQFFHFSLSQNMGLFCKICVALFAFLSGYGFYCKAQAIRRDDTDSTKTETRAFFIKDWKVSGHLALALYRRYWIVYAICVPVGIVFFRHIFPPLILLGQFLGLSDTKYIPEWWYINYYIVLCLLFPLFEFIFWKFEHDSNRIMMIKRAVIFIVAVLLTVLLKIKGLGGINWYYLIAMEGYFCARYHLIEHLVKLIAGKTRCGNFLQGFLIIVFVVCMRLFVWRETGSVRIDLFFAPIFIIGILCVIRNVENKLFHETLYELGRRSIYIWLIHPFFCYYFFQKFTYAPRYTVLIYFLLLGCTYILAEICFLFDTVCLQKIFRHVSLNRLCGAKSEKQTNIR